MYRVVLVDDERLILEGLSRVIAWGEMGCTVVGTASDGQEGLALIRREFIASMLTVAPSASVRGWMPGASARAAQLISMARARTRAKIRVFM